MWSEIISKFQNENKFILDINNELHLSYYIRGLLSDNYIFFIDEGAHSRRALIIKDKKSDINIDKNKFIYWYMFTRFHELINEEENIIKDFNELKGKIIPVIDKLKIPELKDTDNEDNKKKKIDKMNINSEKITKLQEHLNSEAEKNNIKINNLRNFRNTYHSIDLLEKFLNNIQIILKNE